MQNVRSKYLLASFSRRSFMLYFGKLDEVLSTLPMQVPTVGMGSDYDYRFPRRPIGISDEICECRIGCLYLLGPPGTQLLAVDDNLVGDDLLLPRTFGGQCPPAPLRKPRGNEELEATLSVFKLPETEFEKCKRTGRIRYKRDGERRASAPGEMETGSGGGSPSTPGRAGATGHQSQSSSGPSGSPDPAVKEKVQQDTIFWEMAEDGYLQPAPKEESGQVLPIEKVKLYFRDLHSEFNAPGSFYWAFSQTIDSISNNRSYLCSGACACRPRRRRIRRSETSCCPGWDRPVKSTCCRRRWSRRESRVAVATPMRPTTSWGTCSSPPCKAGSGINSRPDPLLFQIS